LHHGSGGVRLDADSKFTKQDRSGVKKIRVRTPLQQSRGGTGSGVQESTPAGFCVFLSDPDPDQE